MEGRILVVDDDRAMCEFLRDDLESRGHSVEWRTSAEAGFEACMESPFDVVLTDLKMPGLDGIEFCNRLSVNRPDIPVIVITAFGSLDSAIKAIRAGAYDFVTKPIDGEMLALVIERALKHQSLTKRIHFLEEQQARSRGFGKMVGESFAVERLFEQIRRVADQDVPVLITGESGTGKELVAQALHQHGPRRDAPFVPVNCAALPGPMLESELFGHAKGAFTSADTERKGLFQAADGGSLLLDEIGEIPLELQPKLLRALESGRVRPLGANQEEPCDVRVIAATNRDLEASVEEGAFREDLFYRVNVVNIEVPPLRSREQDILLLAAHFLEDAALRSGKPLKGIARGAAERLLTYRWPGNVRELKNAIERAVAMTRLEEVTVEDLPERIRDYPGSRVVLEGDSSSELVSLDQMERRYVEHVLDRVGGNKTEAARLLGIGRKTLYRKLESWGL